MKKSIFSAVAVLGLTAAIAVAAPNGNGEGRHRGHGGKAGHERGEARLDDRLNLSDAQKEQWKAARQSFRQENRAFFEQSRQTFQELRAAKKAGDSAKVESLKPVLQRQREQMQQLRAAEEQKLVAILTPAQRNTYDALKAERAAKRAIQGENNGRRHGGQRQQQ